MEKSFQQKSVCTVLKFFVDKDGGSPCNHLPASVQIDMKEFPDSKHKKMEKYILRKAFDVTDHPYLPEEVLWRQKEQFSDGVGYSWVDGLRDYADSVSLCF